MANFYISDLHFGHKNILAYDNRPFADVGSMENILVMNWNNAVSNTDTVYILGDFTMSAKEEEWDRLLSRLKGHKQLIVGNHDLPKKLGKNPMNISPVLSKHFDDITHYKVVNDNHNNVVLCHFPIPCYNNHYHNWYHLYGHVHTGFEANIIERTSVLLSELYEKQHHMYNVGCMMPYMGYTPRTLEHIVNTATEWRRINEQM